MTTTFAADPAPSRSRLFSLRGRLARMEYIAWTLGLIAAHFLVLFTLRLTLSGMGELGRLVYIFAAVLLFYCVLPVLIAVLTIKRAHDFNSGGWLAVLLFIPLINLCFWLIPGNSDENRFGQAPPTPSQPLKTVGTTLIVVFLIGFLYATYKSNDPDANEALSQPATTLQPYRP